MTVDLRPAGDTLLVFPGDTWTFRAQFPDDLTGRTFAASWRPTRGPVEALDAPTIEDGDTDLGETTGADTVLQWILPGESSGGDGRMMVTEGGQSVFRFQVDADEQTATAAGVATFTVRNGTVLIPVTVVGAIDSGGGGGAVASVNGRAGVVVGLAEQDDLEAEATARGDADVALLGAITSEAASRSAADIALDGRLDTAEATLAAAPGTYAPVAEPIAAAHIADTTAAHDASAIGFAPAGTIAATDVQAAIAEVASEAATALTSAVTGLVNGAPVSGDTLGELHARLAVVEALGSLATDAELIAAVAALIGSADTAGDTLGELQSLIGLRLLKSANLSDLANAGTARTNLGVAIGTDVQAFSAVLAATTASFTTALETKLSGIATGATAYTDALARAAAVDDTAYDATTWNGDTTHAPSKNAVRDKFESLSGGADGTGGIFGDGSDGAVTISGTTTLGRDMFYETLVVQNGAILNTAGYVVCSRTSITVDSGGTIQNNGGAGAATTTGGAAPGVATLGGGTAGGAGGTAAGSQSSSSVSFSGTSQGGTGGTGASGAGASGGLVFAFNMQRTVPMFFLGLNIGATGGTNLNTSGVVLRGPTGGGGGGGDGTAGGGGGGGGGIVSLVTKSLVNNGTIRAIGGVGGSPAAGNRGGGGGGGGGVLLLTYNTKTGSGSTSAAGGAGGTGSGTGTSGTTGSAGVVKELVCV